MKDEKVKKGFFVRLIKGNGTKTSSCCGNFEVEEIPNESGNSKIKKGSCCGNFELEEIPDENENNKNKKTPK